MTEKHEEHLEEIKTKMIGLIDAKYRAGQEEHGGNLWEHPQLLEEGLNEVVDLAVYLLTLQSQISKLKERFNVEKIAE